MNCMIYRGTTPKLVFKVNFNTALVEKIYITFSQKDRKPVDKELSDCELEEGKVIVKLTQKDTLSFVSKFPVKIQIRVKLTDGTATATKTIEKTVVDILKDGEI